MSGTTTPDPSVATMAAIALSSVHNPTYFAGGFTNLITIPGANQGVLVPLTNFGDAGGNFNGKNYVCPQNGIYRVSGLIKFSNTGVAGACPAGTSLGCQVSPLTTVNYDLMQFTNSGPLRNNLLFWTDIYYVSGTIINVILYSDVGTTARSGTFSILRVA